jgi:hypothetical protein
MTQVHQTHCVPRSAGASLMGACEVGRGPTVFGNARRV